jgi:hypothetical protein
MCSLSTNLALAQSSYIPTVPPQVTFADITLELDKNSQAIIQKNIQNILSPAKKWGNTLERIALYGVLLATGQRITLRNYGLNGRNPLVIN